MTETEVRTEESASSVPAPPAANAPGQAELEALRQRAEHAERDGAVRRALNGIEWFEPEDAYRELADLAKRNEAGEWEILRGNTRVPLDEAARQLAARKPHWVKARVIGGSGANGGEGSAAGAPAGLSYADLLKPENEERLREYVHNRPRELERLRQAHFK
jgi:hypothetical protein